MTMLSTVRGQKVREHLSLRLGEIRFVPADNRVGLGPGREGFAEMSAETWALLQADEEKGRAYAVARARAMRNTASTNFTVLPESAPVTATDGLLRLERQVNDLARLVQGINSPGAATSVEMIGRRKEIRTLMANVQARLAQAEGTLSLIDELLEAKVLV